VEVRMTVALQEPVDRGTELAGTVAVEQPGERDGDLGETDLAPSRRGRLAAPRRTRGAV
jgi:hypothetical protein